MTTYPSVTFKLPNWVSGEIARHNNRFSTIDEKMDLAIRLAEKNVDEETGGPFAACIFESKSGRLIAPGVDMVVPGNNSLAHAVPMAITISQKVTGTFDLGAPGIPEMELVISAQPCLQCIGTIWRSGVRKTTYAATSDDVERLTGLQEKSLLPKWVTFLSECAHLQPVNVYKNVLRKQACVVLQRYSERGGLIYNPFADTQHPQKEMQALFEVPSLIHRVLQ